MKVLIKLLGAVGAYAGMSILEILLNSININGKPLLYDYAVKCYNYIAFPK